MTTVVAVLVVGLAGGLWYVTGRESRAAADRLGDLVVSEPHRGRDHVPSTTTDAAPTSGDHQGGAVCGVYDRVMTADQQIHTLEHGAIVYQYRPDDVQDTEVQALADLADEFGSHVLVAPNPDLDAPFVATAWTRKMRLDEVDVDRARDFGVAFTGNGPESVACPLN